MCSSRKDDRREGGEKTRKRDSSKKDRNIVCKDKEPNLQQISSPRSASYYKGT